MANYNYYLGPWEWDSGNMPHWRAPRGTVGLIDLRSIPDQSLAGKLGDKPFGFFAVNGILPSEYDLLGSGDLREMSLSAGMKSTWLALLGTKIEGVNLVDGLFDHLTTGCEPTGDHPRKPLVPTVQGNLELHLGGHSIIKTERFKFGIHPHTSKLSDLLHIQYRQHHADIEAGRMRPDHDRRILDYWLDKYRVDKTNPASWKRLVPPEMRGGHPGPLPHRTIIGDTFVESSNTNLVNHTATGPNGGFGWEIIAGTPVVIGATDNVALSSGTNWFRVDSLGNLSGDDHRCDIVISET